jgi:transposase
MAHISGEDRSQLLLLPDAVDDYVGPDNPVRFIDAFVDGLDLEAAGFQRVQPTDKGRPGYDPADLLKLYIYGYLNRIRSSRRLEVETHRNLEVIWLLRQLKPDFKTIADFRRDNRGAFRAVFRQFVRLCRELDLYGRELIAVDGTRIKAVNNRDRNFTRAKLKTYLQRIDERLDRYLDQMNEADADDAGGRVGAVADLQDKIASLRNRKETLERHRQTLDDTGEAQLSLTDPDSRSMHPGTGVGVGYNIQIAVDTKHNLIAEQQVHSKVSDLGLLAETAAAARENLATCKIDAVADRGYYKIEDIEDCEAAGITPYVPKPDRSTARHSGHFPKSEFQYDAATDTYRCPAGERLMPLYRESAGKSRTGAHLVSYVNRAACRVCALRQRCTKKTYRAIKRFENESAMERMADRLAARPEVMDRRRESVEHPFGSIKQWMGQGAFLTRRLGNVRGEFSLTALAYNLRRAINLVGIPALIAVAAH